MRPVAHDKTVDLAARMLVLHRQLPKDKSPHEQESLRRQERGRIPPRYT